MKKPVKRLTTIVAATVLAVSLAGCTAADAARFERLCRSSGFNQCDLFFPGTGKPTPPPVDKGDGETPREKKVTVNASWAEPTRLHVTGTANLGDLEFQVKLGDKVLSRADAQVKEGRYIANLLVEGGYQRGMKLVVSDPADGEVLTNVSLEQGMVTDDEVHSANFRVVRPRLIAADRILLEGTARAFEAMFRVEVWSGDKQLAAKAVQASEGGPAFGWFSTEIVIEGGVPADAEVHYIIVSMKDGSHTVELSLPVER